MRCPVTGTSTWRSGVTSSWPVTISRGTVEKLNHLSVAQGKDRTEVPGKSCYTSFEAEQGMFEIKATWFEEDGWTRDICEISAEYAAAFEPHLPK